MDLEEIKRGLQLEDDVALLRRNNAELRDKCQMHEKEIRHHKYKRCLWLARWCASRSASWRLDTADEQLHKSNFYDKWKKHWLELAEKFKTNNSTAQ